MGKLGIELASDSCASRTSRIDGSIYTELVVEVDGETQSYVQKWGGIMVIQENGQIIRFHSSNFLFYLSLKSTISDTDAHFPRPQT